MHFLSVAVMLLCSLFSLPLSAAQPDRGAELFDILLKATTPREAVMQLSSLPEENGYISWAFLDCHDAIVEGMNISSFRMDFFDSRVTPPALWKDMSHPHVKSMLACHAVARVTEKDVNDFLRSRVFGHKREWSDVSVSLHEDHIMATAYYLADLKLMKLKIRVDISCSIVPRGTALWLEDVSLRLNNQSVPSSLVRRALDDMQPFIDMKNYGLPLRLKKIECRQGECIVASTTLPKQLPFGREWKYVKACPGKSYLGKAF